MRKLLIATRNAGKLAEYRSLLAGLPFEPIYLPEINITDEIDETGDTFRENAVLKAQAYARLSGLLTLADDSGLEVAALDGEPGVRSARYSGPGATDARNIDFLLQRLAAVPPGQRRARFRCVIAVADPDGRTQVAEGECWGEIIYAPRGTQGFGYDPVFYIPELGKAMAELPPAVKNRISHRAAAAREARAILIQLAEP
ncbi:MAG: non-canonical purine NTP pyrophosphatase, RdgB/HAM1 family [Chloroflexi bacterium RBG_16_57_9]|nr:MAG: non-canonical purine NTP pyrophosphatase, RdgB/HAM1 family [Chloroflexi bacterium RBG_16_57_9]